MMEAAMASPPPERDQHTPGPCWATIWVSPRNTIRRVIDEGGHALATHLLGAASGVVWMLNGGIDSWFGPGATVPFRLVVSGVLGSIVGVAFLYVTGQVLAAVGRMLGGDGTAEDLRPAFAWGIVPALVAMFVAGPSLRWVVATVGSEVNAGRAAPLELLLMGLCLLLIWVAGGLWSWVTLSKCIAEIHRFSAWRGLACVVAIQVLPVVIGVLVAGMMSL